jgi:hypothetical protein
MEPSWRLSTRQLYRIGVFTHIYLAKILLHSRNIDVLIFVSIFAMQRVVLPACATWGLPSALMWLLQTLSRLNAAMAAFVVPHRSGLKTYLSPF